MTRPKLEYNLSLFVTHYTSVNMVDNLTSQNTIPIWNSSLSCQSVEKSNIEVKKGTRKKNNVILSRLACSVSLTLCRFQS